MTYGKKKKTHTINIHKTKKGNENGLNEWEDMHSRNI